MIKAKFSCKDCPDRHPGCHAACEKYKAEKAAHEAIRAENARIGAIKGGLTSYQITIAQRNRKRAGRRQHGKDQ